jgi:hypothetical protein
VFVAAGAVGMLAAVDPQAARLASAATSKTSGKKRMGERRPTALCESVTRKRIIIVP